jgi:hypothetical protein
VDKVIVAGGGDEVEASAVTTPMRRTLEATHEVAVEGARLSGQVTLTIDDRVFDVHPGDLVFFPLGFTACSYHSRADGSPDSFELLDLECQCHPSSFVRHFSAVDLLAAAEAASHPGCLELLAIDVSPANRHDSKGIIPVLHQLASCGFKGIALGDLSYRGERLSNAGKALGIIVEPSAGGQGGTLIPEGIRWVVERSLAWASRYCRLR